LTLALEACIDSSLITAGAIIGQMLIPVPVVGAIVGSVATSTIISIVKTCIDSSEQLREQTDAFIQDFKAQYNVLIAKAGDTLSNAGNATALTISSLYGSAKTATVGAIDFAQEKTSEIYERVTK
jgi:phage tail tape-measure protein